MRQNPRLKPFLPFLIALGCFLVSLLLFCPRFYLWWPLWDRSIPESNRAVMVFLQSHNPWITLPLERQLEWRLLFPVIGRAIPPWMLFGFGVFFSFILLWYIAHLVLKRTQSFFIALLACAITSTCGAYFVSMGYLGYYDTAAALCLLLASLEESPLVIWAAAALGPWIDDRFILALPIVFFCQWRLGQPKKFLWTLLGCTFPYLLLRLYAFLINGDGSQSIIAMSEKGKQDPLRLLQGVWDSLRWGWLLLIPAYGRSKPAQLAYGLIIIPACLFLLEVIAGDYSRSVAMALPLMVLGALFMNSKFIPPLWILFFIVLNFATPGFIAFRAFRVQVAPLWIQTADAKLFAQRIANAYKKGWRPRFYMDRSTVRESSDHELQIEVPIYK